MASRSVFVRQHPSAHALLLAFYCFLLKQTWHKANAHKVLNPHKFGANAAKESFCMSPLIGATTGEGFFGKRVEVAGLMAGKLS